MFEKLLNENYRRNISNAVKVRIRFRKNRKKNKHYDKQKRKKKPENKHYDKKKTEFIHSINLIINNKVERFWQREITYT